MVIFNPRIPPAALALRVIGSQDNLKASFALVLPLLPRSGPRLSDQARRKEPAALPGIAAVTLPVEPQCLDNPAVFVFPLTGKDQDRSWISCCVCNSALDLVRHGQVAPRQERRNHSDHHHQLSTLHRSSPRNVSF